jgi:transposase-like protein
MQLTPEQIEELQKSLATAKTYKDLMGADGAIKKLIKNSIEQLLDAEMTEHLGYPKNAIEGNNSGNSRNGTSPKDLITESGEIPIEVPRDRNGTFSPITVPKHQRRLGELEDIIISMYAKGMSTRDIQDHFQQLYSVSLSPVQISHITDRITELMQQWHSRVLDELYPIVFLDAIHFKVREEGKVISKAAYTCLAIDVNGQKNMLGIWIGQAESSRFWLGILNDLKNRGVRDILIACVDGLTGFTEAIEATFPKTRIQQCIIHKIRNTFKYIVSKDKKSFVQDLRLVYSAASEELALEELQRLDEKWGKKYPLAIKSWRDSWTNIATFFEFASEIRTIIYTTNAVEALHRQFRKVTKAKSLFPTDEALSKMLYLSYRDISRKWIMPLQNWPFVISQLSVVFGERITKYL